MTDPKLSLAHQKILSTALRLLPQARNNITYFHKTLSPSTVSHSISEIINDEIPVSASVDDSFDELIIEDLMSRKVPLLWLNIIAALARMPSSQIT